MSSLLTAVLFFAALLGVSPTQSAAEHVLEWSKLNVIRAATSSPEEVATTSVIAISKRVAPPHIVIIATSSKALSTPTSASATLAPLSTLPKPARVPSPVVSQSSLEALVLADLNAVRAASDLAPLHADSSLTTLARSHSTDMLAKNYFSHTDSSGCSAQCRYENAVYSYWSMGENIFWMEGFALSDSAAAQKVVDSWQNSPGHRENDLGDYTNVGIGIAVSGSKVYVTADFSKPR